MSAPADGRQVLSKKTRRDLSPQLITAAKLNHVFTTGEVAQLGGVAPRTVQKWFELGKFPNSYRIPRPESGLGGDRRILRQDLIDFCREQNWGRVLLLLEEKFAHTVLSHGLPARVRDLVQNLFKVESVTTKLFNGVRPTWTLTRAENQVTLIEQLVTDDTVRALLVERGLGKALCRQLWDRFLRKFTDDRVQPAMFVWMYDGDEMDESLPETVVQSADENALIAWTKSLTGVRP